MAWYDENRMVVEGERYWNEIYSRDDEDAEREYDYEEDDEWEYEDLNDREFDIPYEEV